MLGLTKEQERVLDKHEFDYQVSIINKYKMEILILKDVLLFADTGLKKEVLSAIEVRKMCIEIQNHVLASLCKKLGIEMPTTHTEL